MDFLVLGPMVIVADQGDRVPVARPLHRAILSVLLLYAGRPCSHTLLVDALWGGSRPPKDPVGTLLSHISRIRSELGVGGRLQTLCGAYRMNPAPGELDLYRFHHLRDRAQQMLARGDLERAAALLAAALECWRDPALADLPSTPAIDADAAQLTGQRHAAETGFIDVMLALGHHQQVIPDLRRIVTADPLAEQSWAQLILALYRDGRKGEALAAYSRARAVIVRSLGSGPGRELQDLLAQILADGEDVAMDLPSGGHGTRPHRPSRAGA
jgi:DNA-binding SARP family transcriptional activator